MKAIATFICISVLFAFLPNASFAITDEEHASLVYAHQKTIDENYFELHELTKEYIYCKFGDSLCDYRGKKTIVTMTGADLARRPNSYLGRLVFDSDWDALETFMENYPGTMLLVDVKEGDGFVKHKPLA